jgi:hypothetical protein
VPVVSLLLGALSGVFLARAVSIVRFAPGRRVATDGVASAGRS